MHTINFLRGTNTDLIEITIDGVPLPELARQAELLYARQEQREREHDYAPEPAPLLAGSYLGLPLSEYGWPNRHYLGERYLSGDYLSGHDPSGHDLGAPSKPVADQEAGETMLLGCLCGVPDCWALLAKIELVGTVVRWSGYRAWDLSRRLGPFTFSRRQYELSLRTTAPTFHTTAPTFGATAATLGVTDPTLGVTGATSHPTDPNSQATGSASRATSRTSPATDPTLHGADQALSATSPNPHATDPAPRAMDPTLDPTSLTVRPTNSTVHPTSPIAHTTGPVSGPPDLAILDRLRLVPVVDAFDAIFDHLPPEHRDRPANDDVSLRDAHWREAATAAGLPTPIPGQQHPYWIRLSDFFAERPLLTLLQTNLQDLGDDETALNLPQLLADDPDTIESIGALSGGYLLLAEDGRTLVAPGCCGDLRDLAEWHEATQHTRTSPQMVWIGHPWIHVAADGDALLLTGPTEGDPGTELAWLSRQALAHATQTAAAEVRYFARCLQARCAHLAGEENATALSTALLGGPWLRTGTLCPW